jgi:hypothetical protein
MKNDFSCQMLFKKKCFCQKRAVIFRIKGLPYTNKTLLVSQIYLLLDFGGKG